MTNHLDLSFEEWVIYVFDHPVDHLMPEWYWDDEAVFWNEEANPAQTVSYLIQLFENPLAHTADYSDAQISIRVCGFWSVTPVHLICSHSVTTLSQSQTASTACRQSRHCMTNSSPSAAHRTYHILMKKARIL